MPKTFSHLATINNLRSTYMSYSCLPNAEKSCIFYNFNPIVNKLVGGWGWGLTGKHKKLEM